jgi:hypothetical protein
VAVFLNPVGSKKILPDGKSAEILYPSRQPRTDAYVAEISLPREWRTLQSIKNTSECTQHRDEM